MRVPMALVVLAWCLWESQAVWVQDGNLRFSLESVKVLKSLLGVDSSPKPHPTKDGPSAVCTNPKLPAEFQPVCQREGAESVFYRLVEIITPPDPCEICANAACTGCL
ncbi:guanylin-like [Megalops cyprinoides]|uniref:guanylin-like n=1 Tax=Megalops cyprinoides TaxID=118141 RepID=UPI0018654D09|nr:guanylin-like [Megalops cyprinoides]